MQASPDAIAPAAHSTVTLDVGGMKCAGCVKAVEDQLTQHPGVVSATVNLVTEMAMVECQTGAVDPAALTQKLTNAGFPTQLRWKSGDPAAGSEGGNSPAERQRLETRQRIQQLAIATTLLLFSAMGHLEHFGWSIPGLSNLGLSSIWFHWGLATLALAGPGRSIIVDGWRGLRRNAPNMNTLVGLGTVTAYTTSVVALLVPNLGWDCFFDEPVMLVGFILLGRTLEQQARSRAAAAFQSLLALQPALARLIVKDEADMKDENSSLAALLKGKAPDFSASDHTEVSYMPHLFRGISIPADRVRVGEWLQVLPGEKIPVDGEVVLGQTTVNESMLTGEALPVLKQPGDPVSAGSLNQSGAIAIKATRTGRDTLLAQIIALVEAAQTRKAPIQKLADTVAGYFTYGVMAIAVFTFLFWYFIGNSLWHEPLLSVGHWAGAGHMLTHPDSMTVPPSSLIAHPLPLLLSLKLAIAVLVIACPCALGLATPTAILVGSGIGAERGLLIRGGDVLEKVHQLQTVVFDKTGTLTTGFPVVTDCISLQKAVSPDRLLQLAATVESGTRHPLAEAIRQQAQQQELPLLPAQDFYTEPGRGISAQVSDQQVLLGTQDWLEEQKVIIGSSVQAQAQTFAAMGKTVVHVAVDGTLTGLIAVLDTLRPDAKITVEQLQRMGLRVMLLTGDQPAAAVAIAQSLGLASENVLANVGPQAKAAAIAQLQSQGQRVAMVGDGINDALALTQSDVGISLYSGTDVAVETAEIILMRDRLLDVVESIRLSRATFNKIRQNLFWAFAYNTLSIPVAAGFLLPSLGIVLSPAGAGALMAFSSISVVTNSLLLRRHSPGKS